MAGKWVCSDPKCGGEEFASGQKLGAHRRFKHGGDPGGTLPQTRTENEARLPAVKCPQELFDALNAEALTEGVPVREMVLTAVASYVGFERKPIVKVVGHTWARK